MHVLCRLVVATAFLILAACGPATEEPPEGPPDADLSNDIDHDGYANELDCNETNPDIHAGAEELCNGVDDDCSGRADEPFDGDGDGVAGCMGDCDDANASVRPGYTEECNGRDDDCNALTDENGDADGDGYTMCNGECNDDEALVNPGAIEVQLDEEGLAEMVDNDCDGLVDEPLEPCDDAVDPLDAMSYAKAIGLCSNVLSASWNAGSSPQARAIAWNYGVWYTIHEGVNMAVLSSGIAADEDTAGYVVPQSGTGFTNTGPHPDPQPDPGDGCGSADSGLVNDIVELALEIDVPSNAKSFSYDFNFMSAEFPEYVCSPYDDTFVAMLDSAAYNGNISFDAMGRPVSINIGFFDVCDPAQAPSCTGANDLTGTGYEDLIGGGTGWLTTTAPVVGGERITLRFVIFDEGDHILDSVVLIDNLRWELTPVDAPTTIEKPVPGR